MDARVDKVMVLLVENADHVVYGTGKHVLIENAADDE